MRYRIDEKGGNINVQIKGMGSVDAEFLAAFQRCREGRCDCPTDEYDKTEEMRIEKGEAGISLHLEVKPGQSRDICAVTIFTFAPHIVTR